MENKNFTQQNLDSELNSLDGLARAEMPPFFYTRLQARMENNNPLTVDYRVFGIRPAFTMAALFMLVILNFMAIRYFSTEKQSETATESGISQFAKEYNLTETSAYSYADKTDLQ